MPVMIPDLPILVACTQVVLKPQVLFTDNSAHITGGVGHRDPHLDEADEGVNGAHRENCGEDIHNFVWKCKKGVEDAVRSGEALNISHYSTDGPRFRENYLAQRRNMSRTNDSAGLFTFRKGLRQGTASTE